MLKRPTTILGWIAWIIGGSFVFLCGCLALGFGIVAMGVQRQEAAQQTALVQVTSEAPRPTEADRATEAPPTQTPRPTLDRPTAQVDTVIETNTPGTSPTPRPTAEATLPSGGLGITRAEAESILSDAGMEFKPDADYKGIKRTQGNRPRSMDSAELIGPDEGLIYIYLTFDAPNTDAIGPAMGDRYLNPIAEAIGDPELAAWCRIKIREARPIMLKGENFQVEDRVNGRRVSIFAIPAAPGGLVSCSMGELSE